MPINIKYPMAPVVMGSCACGGMIWDYEMVYCPHCGNPAHSGCIERCAECRHVGCRGCLEHDSETGLYHCGVEHRVDDLRVEVETQGGVV